MILNELHLLMQILSYCFFHQWTVSHQGVLISCNMWKDGTEIQSDKQDRFGEIQDGKVPFKAVNVLLRGKIRTSAFLYISQPSENWKVPPLILPELPRAHFIFQICNVFSFAITEVHIKAIQVFAILALAFKLMH